MRRIVHVLLLLAALQGAVLAADPAAVKFPVPLGDVTLTNGKVFHSVVVLSQTSAAISVKHAGGLTKIEKNLLPPEVLAQFPVDEQLAAKEQQAQEEGARRRSEELQLAAQKKAKQAAEQRAAARAQQMAAASGQPAQAKPAGPAVPKPATPEEQLARAPHGLYLTNWSSMGGSLVSVEVKNPTTSTQRLDPRLLMGLTLDSGQTVAATDIKYSVKEIANDWVDAGQRRIFQVVFPGGPRLAALSWTGATEWRVMGPYPEAIAIESPAEAINLARENNARAKEQARINANAIAAERYQRESDKQMVNK